MILEPIEAEPLATCVASHPAERCLFSFQASLTPSLTHFYGPMSGLNGSFLNGMLTGEEVADHHLHHFDVKLKVCEIWMVIRNLH